MKTFASSLHLQAHRLVGLIAAMCLLAGISTLQAQNDKKADDAYLGANGLFNLGLYEQAIGAYGAFLRKYPTHPKVINVQYGMGISHFQLKQYDKAAAVRTFQWVPLRALPEGLPTWQNHCPGSDVRSSPTASGSWSRTPMRRAWE